MKPFNEIRIFEPRTIKFEGVIKGAFWRVPLEANREMVGEIEAFGLGPVSP